MTEDATRRVAIRVLAKIKAYDPRLSTDPEVVEVWAEHLERQRTVDLQELLDAVAEYFDDPHPYVVQAADISAVVRGHRQDAYERRPLYDEIEPPPASVEHRRRCMAEIAEALGNKWSVPQ